MKKTNLLLTLFLTLHAIKEIPNDFNTLFFLKNNYHDCNNLRLHLGCGENKLPGYINIDFSPKEHPLQSKSGADFFCDITQLSFPHQTVTQVRSHHTYEHFNRQTALALLAAWTYWLIPEGTIVIETPDFRESIKQILSDEYSYNEKQVIMRHIFGSHEASWANHYDGWYHEKFKHILELFGIEITASVPNSYLMIRNITIYGTKKINYSFEQLKNIAHQVLKESMVNTSSSEIALWTIWCNEFDKIYENLCSKNSK